MSDERGSLSKNYIECASRLRRLHALVRLGEGDSDQAEALRDEMDYCWIRMTEEERNRSGDLSADLHVLGLNQPLFLDRSTDGDLRQRLLADARKDDWPELRPLLDADASSADLFDRLLFRGIYWAALKDYESSLEFLNSLSNRLDEARSELESMQSEIERLGRIEKATEEIAAVQDRGPLALERIDRVSGEIHRLIVDVRSMGSPVVAPGDVLAAWNAIKERFFLAEAGLQAFSEHAA